MKGLQLIREAIEGMQSDLRLSKERGRIIRLTRLRDALESFSDQEIACMFRIPEGKRDEALGKLKYFIASAERHIEKLTRKQ